MEKDFSCRKDKRIHGNGYNQKPKLKFDSNFNSTQLYSRLKTSKKRKVGMNRAKRVSMIIKLGNGALLGSVFSGRL